MMRPVDQSQFQIMAQVNELIKQFAESGLRVDHGQAYECLLSSDPGRLARRFHQENIRYGRSTGEVHLNQGEDVFFDLPAQNPDEEVAEEDAEEKLRAIMVRCSARHRETVDRVLLEMKRGGGPASIKGAAQAVGVPRAVLYRILAKVRKWVLRPAPPEGWEGIDCASLVQQELELGVAK